MKPAIQTFVFIALLSILFASVAYAFVNELQTNSATQTIINVPYYYVDNNTSDVDSSGDKGTHSNFTAQQSSPDSNYDTLSETSELAHWLSGWQKRIKVEIDHNDINDALSNFPVLVYLSNSSGLNNCDLSCVFDELQSDANRKKIAITTSDGTSQCYVEVERWNTANEQAWLWVKVPNINNTSDTSIYLYYDVTHSDNTNYVGDPNSTPAENVWDSNFKGVWHLSETIGGTGAIQDSTSNNNDGSDNGSPTLGATGKIDGAVSFDGIDDYINIPNSASLQFTSSLTIEAWVNPESFGSGSDVDIILRKGEGNPNDWQLAIHDQRTGLRIEENDDIGLDGSTFLSATTWCYIAGTWNGSIRKVYLNDSEDGYGSKTGSIIPDIRDIYIGGRAGTDLLTGIIDEVRASDTTRSVAWIKASYESGRDDLLNFGSEESPTYEVDLEVQWTNVDYSEANEELCIYYSEEALGSNNTHSLDATGGYMIIGDGTPDWGSVSGTVSFWVKMDSTVQGRFWGQNDNMETRWAGNSLVLDWGGTSSMTSATAFSADIWYFIAIVWDENANNLLLYAGDENNPPTLDANSLNGNWLSTTPSPTQNRFLNGLGGNEPLDGHGDDLRYYNIARSSSEIQSDYNVTITGTETNLRSYFKLDNNFDDIGPDNNDGSAFGSYSFSLDVPFNALTENLQVDVWTGSAWQNVFTQLANGWNNATITSYLTSSNLTIRYKGSNETNDSIQDSWNIDTAVIHAWT